jgi:hypothetical protein
MKENDATLRLKQHKQNITTSNGDIQAHTYTSPQRHIYAGRQHSSWTS